MTSCRPAQVASGRRTKIIFFLDPPLAGTCSSGADMGSAIGTGGVVVAGSTPELGPGVQIPAQASDLDAEGRGERESEEAQKTGTEDAAAEILKIVSNDGSPPLSPRHFRALSLNLNSEIGRSGTRPLPTTNHPEHRQPARQSPRSPPRNLNLNMKQKKQARLVKKHR